MTIDRKLLKCLCTSIDQTKTMHFTRGEFESRLRRVGLARTTIKSLARARVLSTSVNQVGVGVEW